MILHDGCYTQWFLCGSQREDNALETNGHLKRPKLQIWMLDQRMHLYGGDDSMLINNYTHFHFLLDLFYIKTEDATENMETWFDRTHGGLTN